MSLSEGATMMIGRVAKLAGVNVETVRYYQRRGLLAEPDRYYGTFRRYPAETVDQILFIKRAQALSFSLDEIRVLMQSDSMPGCDLIHGLVTQKTEALRRQIDDLGRRLALLEQLARLCGQYVGGPHAKCPLVTHLSGGAPLVFDTVMDCARLE